MFPDRSFPLFVLFSTITAVHMQPVGRIIGGETCSPNTSKFLVSIRKSGLHFCGGSLIKLDMVMTAAHCVLYIQEIDIEVFAGFSRTNLNGTQRRSGKHIFTHMEGERRTDIAILQLDRVFQKSSSIDIVRLPSHRITNLERECATGVVMGWGLKEVYDPSIKQEYPFYKWDGNLQCVSLTILTNSKCQKYVPDRVYDWMFCAWFEPGGKDACMGDSGGPLLCDGIQIGIISSGYGCAMPRQPAFYVRVDRVLDFIYSSLNNEIGRKSSGASKIFSVNLLVISIYVYILVSNIGFYE